MWTIIGLVVLALVAYLIALAIVGFLIEMGVGAETARTPPVIAAIAISAAILLFTITYFVVAYLSRGHASGSS
jgi:hypothetical protein